MTPTTKVAGIGAVCSIVIAAIASHYDTASSRFLFQIGIGTALFFWVIVLGCMAAAFWADIRKPVLKDVGKAELVLRRIGLPRTRIRRWLSILICGAGVVATVTAEWYWNR